MALQAVEWRTWEQGSAEARQNGKNILTALVRDGCHYCHDMERDVFNDKKMTQWIETCFVPVKVNLTVEQVPFAARVPMTPTFVILRPDGTILKTIPGSWNIPDFTELASPACTKE